MTTRTSRLLTAAFALAFSLNAAAESKPGTQIAAILNGKIVTSTPPTAQLPANARVAIIGDSITEQKLYSKFIETYLLVCTGRRDIKCFQFGWGGETAIAFSNRLENDLGPSSPPWRPPATA